MRDVVAAPFVVQLQQPPSQPWLRREDSSRVASMQRPFVLHGAWQRVIGGDVLGPLDTSASAMAGHVVEQAGVARRMDAGPRKLDLRVRSMPDRCSFTGNGDIKISERARLISSYSVLLYSLSPAICQY